KLYDGQKLLHRFSLKQDPFCLPAVDSVLNRDGTDFAGRFWDVPEFSAGTSGLHKYQSGRPPIVGRDVQKLWVGTPR
ncbi:hypothetical protein E4U28_000188, partial [Claviceps purpurea]